MIFSDFLANGLRRTGWVFGLSVLACAAADSSLASSVFADALAPAD
ncbi:hypothetical protein [Paraburkholderia fungorum]|nr:hypothetical protein [Paraburkholderia fungorum]